MSSSCFEIGGIFLRSVFFSTQCRGPGKSSREWKNYARDESVFLVIVKMSGSDCPDHRYESCGGWHSAEWRHRRVQRTILVHSAFRKGCSVLNVLPCIMMEGFMELTSDSYTAISFSPPENNWNDGVFFSHCVSQMAPLATPSLHLRDVIEQKRRTERPFVPLRGEGKHFHITGVRLFFLRILFFSGAFALQKWEKWVYSTWLGIDPAEPSCSDPWCNYWPWSSSCLADWCSLWCHLCCASFTVGNSELLPLRFPFGSTPHLGLYTLTLLQ